MREAVNNHALPIYTKNRIASLLCIFESTIGKDQESIQSQARRKQLQIGGAHITDWGAHINFFIFFLIFFFLGGGGGGGHICANYWGGGTAPNAPPIPTALNPIPNLTWNTVWESDKNTKTQKGQDVSLSQQVLFSFLVIKLFYGGVECIRLLIPPPVSFKARKIFFQ